MLETIVYYATELSYWLIDLRENMVPNFLFGIEG